MKRFNAAEPFLAFFRFCRSLLHGKKKGEKQGENIFAVERIFSVTVDPKTEWGRQIQEAMDYIDPAKHQ